MKYRAKVTIEFDVTVRGKADEYTEDEIERQISDHADNAAYALAGTVRLDGVETGTAWADVELKPAPVKRTSKRRR